ncbi:MAG: DUF2865 domain-containing protein [Hyphomicrobiales bacterium]|nr:DUF2865 domain-containing protein [Hyphomicrobiales bacterium]
MVRHRAPKALSVARFVAKTAAIAFVTIVAPNAGNTQGGYYDQYPPRGQQGYEQGYGQQGGGQQAQGYSPREIRCRELEQQLASDWTRGSSAQDQLPRLDEEIRNFDRLLQRAESDAERGNCYEDMFIFGRSLRRTPRCLDLNRQIEDSKRRIADLRQQRDNLGRSGSRRQQQEGLVAELAKNRCGESYQRQYAARQRDNSFFSLWDDEDSAPGGGGQYSNYRPENMPYGAYRTMCVRTCDGYYFPISYSTLQSRFREDEDKCRSQCAAPAELFVYRNPGEEVEQMVSLGGASYADMPYAFRNRKQYVKGCSCNLAEFSLDEIAKSEKALKDEAEARRTAAVKPKSPAGAPGVDRPDTDANPRDNAPPAVNPDTPQTSPRG